MKDNIERDLGEQPLTQIMKTRNLKLHNLAQHTV